MLTPGCYTSAIWSLTFLSHIMRNSIVLLSLLVIGVCYGATDQDTIQELKSMMKTMQKAFDEQAKLMKVQTSQIVSLARQVSQQQLHVEDVARSEGDSGVKIIRLDRTGSRPYYNPTYSGGRMLAIHEHANYKETVGMGEFAAVLNGVEFRTRHNDYKMRRPSTTSSKYGASESIKYPDVPPEVLAQPTLDLQIKEMREWFKAWKNSDYTKRDYRKYFKANLCYLEGMWTEADGGQIDEPFASDRHAIAAKSFFELQEKIKYTAYTGRKSSLENFAYLPSTVADVDDYGNIKYSQWNYNILCHPLNTDVPLARFRLEDDLNVRLAARKTFQAQEESRAARFKLYDDPSDAIFPKKSDGFTKRTSPSFLDILMNEIPGKDNYGANLTELSFEALVLDPYLSTYNKKVPLNVGYYHRNYKIDRSDAMGVNLMSRGFSDANLFVAYNTQSKITPAKLKLCNPNRACTFKDEKAGKCSRTVCTTEESRVSYAIPLEIIYTTPLQTWNPYGLQYFEDSTLPSTLNTNGTYKRTGDSDPKMAYAGISKNLYYMTPSEFYGSDDGKVADRADTAKDTAGVLDAKNIVRMVSASGVKIFTDNIPGVGKMRIRYPIAPAYDEGNSIYKELYALKEMTMYPKKYSSLYPGLQFDNETLEHVFNFELPPSTKVPPGLHTHTFELTEDELNQLKNRLPLKVQTSEDNGHSHQLNLFYDVKLNRVMFSKCDGMLKNCWDGHIGWLVECTDCPV